MDISKNLPKKIAFCDGPYGVKRGAAYWGVFCD